MAAALYLRLFPSALRTPGSSRPSVRLAPALGRPWRRGAGCAWPGATGPRHVSAVCLATRNLFFCILLFNFPSSSGTGWGTVVQTSSQAHPPPQVREQVRVLAVCAVTVLPGPRGPRLPPPSPLQGLPEFNFHF